MKKRWILLLLGVAAVFVVFGAGYYRGYYPVVLMYHSVDLKNAGITPAMSIKDFERQMKYIVSHGYKVVPLERLVREVDAGRIHRKWVAITFDDGWRDNVEAVKILNRWRLPATIFMIVGYIGRDDYLTKEQIRWIEESGNVRIGCHTYSHSYLPKEEDLVFQIKEAKKRLEEVVGHKVLCFSYPIGGYNRKIMKLVEGAGFLCAVTTNRGYSRRWNKYAIRRVKVKGKDMGWKLWWKLSGYYDLFRKVKSPE